VLRKARCPVLTVPPRVEGPPPGDVLFTRILCPIDFSDASLGALEYALSLARASDARLTLLHALELFEEGPSVPAYDLSEFHRLRQQEAERALVTLVPEDAGEWCRPQTIVANGSAYRAILRLAEEEGTDLIVIGVHGRNPVERLILGSTTERVVRGAPCPVLTIRPLEA
jgi:nucleotide-binding universal stress UspA family protein